VILGVVNIFTVWSPTTMKRIQFSELFSFQLGQEMHIGQAQDRTGAVYSLLARILGEIRLAWGQTAVSKMEQRTDRAALGGLKKPRALGMRTIRPVFDRSADLLRDTLHRIQWL